MKNFSKYILAVLTVCFIIGNNNVFAVEKEYTFLSLKDSGSNNLNFLDVEPTLNGFTFNPRPYPPIGDFFDWPLQINKYKREKWIPPLVSSFYVTQRSHKNHVASVDVSTGNCGSRIIASKSGIVNFIGDTGNTKGRGVYVILSHYDGVKTVYAHFRRGLLLVEKGESVEQGQVLGFIGLTGRTTGCHLHFEVWGAYNFLNNY